MKRARFITATSCAVAGTFLSEARGEDLAGQVIFKRLATAPYPHESRIHGHVYENVLYSAAQHYSDSTVGIVVPPQYRFEDAVDFVVHFHGWRNNVAHAITYYKLAQQLIDSRVNAILIVPQGPLDAPDSGFGKLELDQDGFRSFMQDMLSQLKAAGIVHTNKLGRVVLSAHSGGYGGAGGVLTRGGLNDNVSDVLLFDSAYGYYDAFAAWSNASPDHHLLSLFTDDTSTGNAALMGMVQGAQPNLYVRLAKDMTAENLRTRAPTFILTTDVAHDELLQRRNWYRLFLQATALQRR